APEARMDHVGVLRQQRGDLGAVLARAESRELRRDDLGVWQQRLDGGREVLPRILAVGVVLVDAGDARRGHALVEQVAGGGHIVHRRGRAGAEQVFRRGDDALEHLRRAAVEEDRQRLDVLGDRGDGRAIAARRVAEDRADAVALDEVAIVGDDLRARLVDDDRNDARAGYAGRVVGRGNGALVDRLDDDLGGVARRDAERAGGGARQEVDEADLVLALKLLRG